MQRNTSSNIQIYTIVITRADTDRADFPDPDVKGSYLSLSCARAAFAQLVDETTHTLDKRYDRVEHGDDHWEACQDGYNLMCFIRIEILTSELCDDAAFKCSCNFMKEAPI